MLLAEKNFKRSEKRPRYLYFFWGYILSLSFLFSCTSNENQEDTGKNKTVLTIERRTVKVSVLRHGPFELELVSNGVISALQRADLRFVSPEVIEEIYVKNGQWIEKGQKIAELSQFKLKNAVRQALDNLDKSKLELQDVLISQGFSIEDSLKVPKETLRIAKVKSNYETSLIQYELAQYNLESATLLAPFSGTIANLSTKKYNLANPAEPFCTLIENRNLGAEFQILESEVALLKVGDHVVISPFAVANYSVRGVVDEINPEVGEDGMIKVRAKIVDNERKLFNRISIKVRIKRNAGNQLVIPKEALVLRNNKKVVFTAKNGKAIWNYVQTGLENSKGFVVTEGLKPGDSVIFDGNLNLSHESPIYIE